MKKVSIDCHSSGNYNDLVSMVPLTVLNDTVRWVLDAHKFQMLFLHQFSLLYTIVLMAPLTFLA